MGATVHPTAIVEAGAEIADGANIGPYCHIGPGAVIGADVQLKSHVVIEGRTTLGERTVVYPFAVLGGPPQHLKMMDQDTRLTIGADCIIREHATIHLGTEADAGETRLADRVFVMAAAHIGHDCQIAAGAVIASNCSLGGHCKIGEDVFLGGLVGVHQFCRIGARAYVGGCAAVAADVIPYGSVLGNRAALGGLNVVGLKRSGASRDTVKAMTGAYRDLFEGEGVFRDRVDRVEERYREVSEVAEIISFIREGGSRPVMGPRE